MSNKSLLTVNISRVHNSVFYTRYKFDFALLNYSQLDTVKHLIQCGLKLLELIMKLYDKVGLG